MIHLTIQQLSSYLDGELNEASVSLAQEHLGVCEACSSTLARLGKLEEAIARVLTSNPDESFFEEFTRKLEERIRSEGKKTAAPASSSERVAPRPIVPVSVATTPLEAVAFEPSPVVRAPKRRALRLPVRGNGDSFSWAAAMIIIAIAGSAGALIFGTELASYWLDTSGAGAPLRRGGGGDVRAEQTPPMEPKTPMSASLAGPPVAAATDGRDTQAAGPGESSPEAESNGDLDPIEETPVEREGQRSAATYEAAATEWESALPSLHGDEYREARFHLAEARYRAWQTDPTEQRARSAAGAIRAYLVGAPPGSDREKATLWLVQLEEARY